MPIPETEAPEPDSYIIDGHVDLLYAMLQSHPDTSFENISDLPVTLEKMRDANAMVIVSAFYCPDTHNGEGSSARFLKNLFEYEDKYLTSLVRITSSDALKQCIDKKTPGMIRLIENSDCLLETSLETLRRIGIKVAGLTHVGRNRIGDGNNIPFPDGLTGAGKELVQNLAREGFAFDAAHLAEPGFRDLTRIYEGPLLSSHTGVRALCDTPRNLTKEQIRVILDRKGVIGIAADPKMLSPSAEASIEDVFRHIDWIAQAFETDGIAVGSDFCGFHTVNSGLEDITRLHDLRAMLLKKGYPEQSVRGIMGENWYKFYSALLTAMP